MSIETENPQTIKELVDAASNLVEQMQLAHMIHDEATFRDAHHRAGQFLLAAMCLIEEKGIE